MAEGVSGNEGALLAHLKALAARGASLTRESDGAGVVRRRGRDKPTARMSPAEFLAAIDRGFVSHTGEGRYILSKLGATSLRVALNRPQDAAHSMLRVQKVAAGRAAPQSERAGVNVAESPLAWLRQRRDKAGQPLIDEAAFEAGERLRAEFTLAQMMPRVTSSWNPAASASRPQRGTPGAALETSERAVAARQRFEAAMAAVGPELSGVLIDVCCFLKGLEQAESAAGWPRRSGKVVLQLALARLARHYRIGGAGDGSGGGHDGGDRAAGNQYRIRHWGAPDYRPTIDGGDEP